MNRALLVALIWLLALGEFGCNGDDTSETPADTGINGPDGSAGSDVGGDASSAVLCPVNNLPTQGTAPQDPDKPIDRSCLGQVVAKGCDTLRICGKAITLVLQQPIAVATYEFFDETGALLANATTDSKGEYCAMVPVTAGGFKGRYRVSKPEYRSHDVYLGAIPWGFSHDEVTLGMEKEKDLKQLAPVMGLPEPDPDKGIVDPFILDCAFEWLRSVEIELDRPYEKRFYIGPNSTLVENAPGSIEGQLSGALFVNVEPGPVTATFKLVDAEGNVGEVIGTASGEVRAGHWTALPALVQ